MISQLDKIFFAKHLALMLRAGLSLQESVATIQKQTSSRKFKKILVGLLKDINNGQSLASSLEKHPKVFSKFFIGLIQVGEESGNLEKNLEYLAGQLAKNYNLQRRIRAALIYPAIIFVSAVGLGAGLSFFILPKLIKLFESLEIELPLATRILLFIIVAVQNYGFYILAGIIILIIFFRLLWQIKFIKLIVHHSLLYLPIAKSIFRNLNLVYFTFNLGLLLQAGLPIIKALEITEKSLTNLIYQEKLKALCQNVKQGRPVAQYLKKQKQLFPLIVSQMTEVGEKTGTLDSTLLYLAKFYEKEISSQLKDLANILEPVLLIIVGLIVAFVAVSIISPIYQLTQGLHG